MAPENWYPVPMVEPGEPLPEDDRDRHLIGPTADAVVALIAVGLVTLMVLTLALQAAHMIVNLYIF